MNKKYLIIFLSVILIGLVGFNAYSFSFDSLKDNNKQSANMFEEEDSEQLSPYDWIKEDQILVYNNMVVIRLRDAEWASFTDTNSMDPVIDYNANAIQIVPKSEEDIHIGDIVSYESGITGDIIIHRVIERGYDNKGWYVYVKGDNNNNRDPEKIRFSQIDRVVVAIIY